jgi:transcription initiation factor TFIID subunit TAF12
VLLSNRRLGADTHTRLKLDLNRDDLELGCASSESSVEAKARTESLLFELNSNRVKSEREIE